MGSKIHVVSRFEDTMQCSEIVRGIECYLTMSQPLYVHSAAHCLVPIHKILSNIKDVRYKEYRPLFPSCTANYDATHSAELSPELMRDCAQ